MPRTTKESSKKANTKSPKKAVSTAKKETTRTTKSSSASTKKVSTKKATPVKKSSSTIKSINSKIKKVKEISNKKTSTKKVASKKSTTRKTASKKVIKQNSAKIDVLEYYDLPYRYNQTIVKVLAQTPKTLFVYWDISDDDRKSYIKQYGENFFENTKPVLIITNTTMNYTFEIEINDFANCWYFNITDEKCNYKVELGRRPKENKSTKDFLPNNYLYITSSNQIESPNGHILFEKEQKTLYYRNVKTNEIYSKYVANLNFVTRLGRIYKLYDIYNKLYKDDELLGLNNPTSKFF